MRKRNDSEEEEREHDAPMAVEQLESVPVEPFTIPGLLQHDGGLKPRKAAKEPVLGTPKPVAPLSFQDDDDGKRFRPREIHSPVTRHPIIRHGPQSP